MKLIDELIGRAVAAENAAGELAQNELAAMGRDQAYKQLQNAFDRAIADGYLDENEVEELMAGFRAAGLDTSTLATIAKQLQESDGVVRADAEIRTKIGDQLREARMSVREEDVFFNMKVQMLMQEHDQSIQLVANIQKSEHDKYMTAIRNMQA